MPIVGLDNETTSSGNSNIKKFLQITQNLLSPLLGK
jgi:hypothetical protein